MAEFISRMFDPMHNSNKMLDEIQRQIKVADALADKAIDGEVVGVFRRPDKEMHNVTPFEQQTANCRHRYKSFTISGGWRCSECKASLTIEGKYTGW